MDRPAFSRPVTVDIVPAVEVDALLEAAERESAQLQQRATAASAAAAAAEADARTAGIDGSSTTWTMVRLERFLENLKVEAQRDRARSSTSRNAVPRPGWRPSDPRRPMVPIRAHRVCRWRRRRQWCRRRSR